MSDDISDIARRILSGGSGGSRSAGSKKWDPKALDTRAQAELKRGVRESNFVKMHRDKMRDPMSIDLIGWDESMAKSSPWPWCSRCKTIVRAYGVEDVETMHPKVWARCHGTKQELRVERPSNETGTEWLRLQIRHMVFFAG